MGDNRILYNYESLLEYAHEMEVMADNLDEITLQRLDKITEYLRTHWEGESFDKFYEAYLYYRQDMEKLPEVLRAFAKSIRDSVETVQDIEREAASRVSDALH